MIEMAGIRRGIEVVADDGDISVAAPEAGDASAGNSIAYTWARKALEDADGDVSTANQATIDQIVARLPDSLGEDRTLLIALCRLGASAALGSVIRAERAKLLRHSAGTARSGFQGKRQNVSVERHEERVLALARSNLFGFVLPGGKRLGDALRPEVRTAAGFYTKQSVDMGHKGKWLSAVADAMKSDTARVSSALSEAQLDRLRREALDEAA